MIKRVKATKPIRQGCVEVRVGDTGKIITEGGGRKYDYYVRFDGWPYPVGVHKNEVEFI